MVDALFFYNTDCFFLIKKRNIVKQTILQFKSLF